MAAASRGESTSDSRRGCAGLATVEATVAAAAVLRAPRAATGSTVEKPFLLGPSSRRSVFWLGSGLGLRLGLGLRSGLE